MILPLPDYFFPNNQAGRKKGVVFDLTYKIGKVLFGCKAMEKQGHCGTWHFQPNKQNTVS